VKSLHQSVSFILRVFERELHGEEVTCGPLSEVIAVRTPNLAIQFEKRALAQSAVKVVKSGTASGQRVVLSIMVKM